MRSRIREFLALEKQMDFRSIRCSCDSPGCLRRFGYGHTFAYCNTGPHHSAHRYPRAGTNYCRSVYRER